MSATETGVVKAWDITRHFGFIKRAAGPDVFVHRSAMIPHGIEPAIGDSVRFEIIQREKGVAAVNCEIVFDDTEPYAAAVA